MRKVFKPQSQSRIMFSKCKNIISQLFFKKDNFFVVEKKQVFFALLFIFFCIFLLSYLGLSRDYFSFGTETDYLLRFMPDADRLIKGDSLTLEHHPPAYSIILAAVQIVVDNWLKTGVLVSLISSLGIFILSFLIFYRISGLYAAWGSILALASSPVFLNYSVKSTSDVIFLAIILGAIYSAFKSLHSGSIKWWAITGLVIGIGYLTRSNGIALLFLFIFPFLRCGNWKNGLKKFIFLFVGFIMVILLWGAIATVTHSPFSAKGTYELLAVNHYPAMKAIGDSMDLVRQDQKFNSTLEVILYDPVRHVKVFIRNFLIVVPKFIFEHNNFLAFPLNLLALPGLFFLFSRSKNFYLSLYIIFTLFYTALLSLFVLATPARFFLVWIPLLGAGIAACTEVIIKNLPNKALKYIALILLIFLFLFIGVKQTYKGLYKGIQYSQKELKESVPIVQQHIPSGSTIIARKPHIAFYTKSERYRFPNVDNVDKLKAELQLANLKQPIYIYYGTIERRLRPQFSFFLNPEKIPSWLDIVAKSEKPKEWVLLKVN